MFDYSVRDFLEGIGLGKKIEEDFEDEVSADFLTAKLP